MAWRASFMQGTSSFKAFRLDEALNHFSQASTCIIFALNPRSHPLTRSQALDEQGGDQQCIIYDSRAAVYEKLGMLKEALRDAETVVKLAKYQGLGYVRAARLLLLARRFDASWSVLCEAEYHGLRRLDEIKKLSKEVLEAMWAEEGRKRAARNQFEKLPAELLGEIFRLVVWSDVAALIGILRVCRYWRQVAWHLPTLWGTLVLTPNSPMLKLSLWIGQSKGQIHELHVKATSHVDWPFQELKNISWDTLRVCKVVDWDVAEFLHKNGLVPHAFANLQVLEMKMEICIESEQPVSPLLFPLLQTTGVRSVSFVQSGFMFSLEQLSMHLTTLTTLILEWSTDDAAEYLLPILEANIGLETLIIQEDYSYMWPANTKSVRLLHLRHLELGGDWASSLLTVITMPVLEVLKIKDAPDELDLAFIILTTARSLTKLKHLVVDNCFTVTPAVLIRLLKDAPALTHLELLRLVKGPNDVIKHLAGNPTAHPLNATILAGTGEENILCPALTHINLASCGDICTSPLIRLVQERLPTTFTAAPGDVAVAAAGPNLNALIFGKPAPVIRNCSRILGLTLDGCDGINASWLPWFRERVPVVSWLCYLKEKPVWK